MTHGRASGNAVRDVETLVAEVARRFCDRALTLAVAESCTGGLVATRLTDRPGASAYLVAGIISYADSAKQALLDVRSATLDAHGAVSRQTAREMAEGVRRAADADVGLSVTGIAGPSGGTESKPVGTVWIAAAVGDRIEAERFHLAGDRAAVRDGSVRAALALLLHRVQP